MTRICFWATATVLMALPLSHAQASPRKVVAITVSDEGVQTLQDLQASAAKLANDADQFKMMVNNPDLDSQSQEPRLAALREEINAMGREMHKLEAERDDLALWEKQAIDQTLPLLKDSAANTENAIKYFNDNRPHLWTSAEYRNYAGQVWKDSEQMAKDLKNNLELAKLRGEEQHLNNSLGAAVGQ